VSCFPRLLPSFICMMFGLDSRRQPKFAEYRNALLCIAAGPAAPAPALSLQLGADARWRGGVLQRARLPGAVLSASLADPDYDITRCATTERLGAVVGLAGLCLERAGKNLVVEVDILLHP